MSSQKATTPVLEPKMSQEEINEHIKNFNIDYYLGLMENRNRIFYAIVSMTNIVFTNSIPTLCVSYSRNEHDVIMRINPKFFFSKNIHERIFLLSHEAMHVILMHLDISKDIENHQVANIAQDIVINESLLNDYFISKRHIKNLVSTLCSVDVIFTPAEIAEHKIVKNGTWKYYYDLIMKIKPELKNQNCNHGDGEKIPDYILDDLLQDALGKLTDEELEDMGYDIDNVINKFKKPEDIKKNDKAGKTPVGEMINVILERRNKKVNWKSLLKKHYYRLLKRVEVDKYNFQKTNRRNSLLLNSELSIPNYSKIEVNLIKKYDVYFFLDTSGSCYQFAQEFYNFARTLPEDYCRIKMFTFDTELYPVNPKKDKTLQGCGGTSFSCIESYLQTLEKYPSLVIVVTDGFGDNVSPINPKNWVWFLTEQNSQEFISPESERHVLTDIYK